MTDLAKLLIQAGGLTGLFSIATLYLTNRYNAKVREDTAADARLLAADSAAAALASDEAARAAAAQERRYEDRRDALLKFQDEIVSVMAEIARFENAVGTDGDDGTSQLVLHLDGLSRSLYRAMAFSGVDTANSAKRLHEALVHRVEDPGWEPWLGSAFAEWTEAVRGELDPTRGSSEAPQR